MAVGVRLTNPCGLSDTVNPEGIMRTLFTAVAGGVLVAALAGCVGTSSTPIIRTPVPTSRVPNVATPTTPTSTAPAAPTTAPGAGAPTDPVADYTFLGFDAQQLWDLCAAAVPEQNAWVEDTHPGLTRLAPLTVNAFRDFGSGTVGLIAPSALTENGKPISYWVCTFSGTPESPHLVNAAIADK